MLWINILLGVKRWGVEVDSKVTPQLKVDNNYWQEYHDIRENWDESKVVPNAFKFNPYQI